MSESKFNSLPRRNVLQILLGGGLLTGAALFAPKVMSGLETARIQEMKVDWGDQDLIENPKIWLEQPELAEKAVLDILDWGSYCEQLWKYYDLTNGQPETMHVDFQAWEKNTRTLVTEVSRWGSLLSWTESQELEDVRPIVESKYQEMATYLWVTLAASQQVKKLPIEDAYQELTQVNSFTLATLTRGGDAIDRYLPESLKRLDISASWNIPWSEISDNRRVEEILPVVLRDQISDFKGTWFDDVVKNSEFIFQARPDYSELSKEKKSGIYIGFEPEVQMELAKKMKELGLEYSFKSIRWGGTSSDGIAEQRGGEISYGASLKALGSKEYEEIKGDWWKKMGHEITHWLVDRSKSLEDKEAIEFMNHWLKIVHSFNPLKSVKDTFVDSVEIPDNDYYVDCLLGANAYLYPLYGKAIVAFSDEFLSVTGAIRISEYMINKHLGYFSPYSFFDDLEKDVDSMTGFDKLLSKTILDNREWITDPKRNFRMNAQKDFSGNYLSSFVLPLVLGHLTLYKPDLVEAALTEDNNNATLLTYFKNFRERFSQYAERNINGEELLGIIMGTLISRKVCGEDLGELKEVEGDYNGMLDILTRNNLI